MTELRRYAAQGTFRVWNNGREVKGVKTAVTLPFVALDSFDAMQMAVLKIQEAHEPLGALMRVDLIDLGPAHDAEPAEPPAIDLTAPPGKSPMVPTTRRLAAAREWFCVVPRSSGSSAAERMRGWMRGCGPRPRAGSGRTRGRGVGEPLAGRLSGEGVGVGQGLAHGFPPEQRVGAVPVGVAAAPALAEFRVVAV